MAEVWPLATSAITGQAWAYAVVLARVVGLAWTAPALSTPGLGWRVRLGLAVMITLAVAPAASPGLPRPLDGPAAALLVPIELGAGALLGLSAALLVAAARQAGEVVGLQAGLAPAALFDPDLGDELNPLGHLYGVVALGAFLAMDGPLKLVGSLAESYRAIPAGGLDLSPETIDLAFGRVGWALGLAVRAAAPAALALVLAGLALGLLGRAAPSLQMMSLALPIRAAVGLAVVFFAIAALAGMLAGAWGELGIS